MKHCYFEIIVGAYAVVRNHTERSSVPFNCFAAMVTSGYSTPPQQGY